jgi:hypothetical protein
LNHFIAAGAAAEWNFSAKLSNLPFAFRFAEKDGKRLLRGRGIPSDTCEEIGNLKGGRSQRQV